MSQREKMKSLFARNRGDEIATARAYAKAEEVGEIVRKSNSHNRGSITYAKALIRDGKRKGWLKLN